MQRRLATARSEIEAAEKEPLFEAVVVNDELETAYKQLRALVEEDATAVLRLQ
jgi:guanylate kinase